MIRKDFEKFAAVFREHIAEMDRVGLDGTEKVLVQDFLYSVAGDIADVCESSNDDFDRESFLSACGF